MGGSGSAAAYSSEPTPIPLGLAPTDASGSTGKMGYTTVNESGVVAWNGGDSNIGLYTDANGQITLTVQNGGVSYYNDTYGLSSSAGATSGADTFWSYATKGDSAGSTLGYQLAVTPSTTAGSATGFGSSAEQVGVIYFGSGTTTTTTTGTGLDYTHTGSIANDGAATSTNLTVSVPWRSFIFRCNYRDGSSWCF